MTFSRSLALYLIVYLAHASPRIAQARSRDSDKETQKVTWLKPSPGDIFSSGDTIQAKWTSKKPIVSPSVSLCSLVVGEEADDNGSDCGGTVWPEIKQDGGVFSFTLAVPETASAASFHLKMKDDFGNIIESPAFSISLSSESAGSSGTSSGSSVSKDVGLDSEGSSSETSSGAAHDGSFAQVPFDDQAGGDGGPSPPGLAHAVSSDSGSIKPHSPSGHIAPAPSDVSVGKALPSENASHTSQTQAIASPFVTGTTRIPISPNTKNDDSVPPQNAMLSRAGLPTAAIAVPISLVGATMLASLGLFIMHRRSLATQRARNARLINIQRNASVRTTRSGAPSFASVTSKKALIDDPDIEKAIDALCGRDTRSLSRCDRLQRDEPVGYAPVTNRYPAPRQDVRRERTRTYDRVYNWSPGHDRGLRFSRAPSDRYIRSPSSGSIYNSRYPRSPVQGYARSLRAYHRRSGAIRALRRDRDREEDDDDGASSTDTILSGYASPVMSSRRLPRHESYQAWPRLPPRSHSRQTAPEMESHRYRHSDDDGGYSSRPRSHRSW